MPGSPRIESETIVRAWSVSAEGRGTSEERGIDGWRPGSDSSLGEGEEEEEGEESFSARPTLPFGVSLLRHRLD